MKWDALKVTFVCNFVMQRRYSKAVAGFKNGFWPVPECNAINLAERSRFRHCERSEAIQTRIEPAARLLRFARNDESKFIVLSIAQPGLKACDGEFSAEFA